MAACAAAACSISTSLAGLSGPSPGPDALDGGAGDGAAPRASFCAQLATKPLLCADFDENAPLDLGWSSTTLTAGGMLDIDPIAKSLRSSTPVADSPGKVSAYLSYLLVAKVSRLHVEARLKPLQVSSGGSITPFSLDQRSSGAYRGLVLYVDPQGARVQEETNAPMFVFESHALAGPVVIGQWQTYGFDFGFGPSSISLEVSVDGVSKLKVPALKYGWESAPISVNAGIAYSLTKDAVSYELDNIVVDAR